MQTRKTPPLTDAKPSPAAPAARAVARQNPARRAGFTLIEMLVVVIIIAILAGMVLGLSKISSKWTQKSKTNTTLGKVRSAIEQFNAEYGKYPPVPVYQGLGQPFFYEFPKSNGMNQAAYTWLTGQAFPATIPPSMVADTWGSDRAVFTFGLMSFLLSRYNDRGLAIVNSAWPLLLDLKQWTSYNYSESDQTKDKEAVKLWAVDIAGVWTDPGIGRSKDLVNFPDVAWTNGYITVKDDWGHELHYQSMAPYMSYRLWSDGPDGVSGTPDDLSTGPGY